MADIELVIKIPEGDYKHILHRQREYCITTTRWEDIIAKGTPLPKGHGDLKDADEMKRKMGNLDGVGMIGRCIDEFPTIIDADR